MGALSRFACNCVSSVSANRTLLSRQTISAGRPPLAFDTNARNLHFACRRAADKHPNPSFIVSIRVVKLPSSVIIPAARFRFVFSACIYYLRSLNMTTVLIAIALDWLLISCAKSARRAPREGLMRRATRSLWETKTASARVASSVPASRRARVTEGIYSSIYDTCRSARPANSFAIGRSERERRAEMLLWRDDWVYLVWDFIVIKHWSSYYRHRNQNKSFLFGAVAGIRANIG